MGRRHGSRPSHPSAPARRLPDRLRPPFRGRGPRALSGLVERAPKYHWGVDDVEPEVRPVDVKTVDDVRDALAQHDYLADEGLATAIFLALSLQRPLLLEGEAGVGKTEVAKVLARWTGGELVRLQCYEGIDAAQAVYEWDYSRQLLHLRAVEASHRE